MSCSVWPTLPEARMTPGAQDEVRIGMERVIGYILDITRSPGIKRDKIMRNTKPACECKRQILCKTSPIERFYTNPVEKRLIYF